MFTWLRTRLFKAPRNDNAEWDLLDATGYRDVPRYLRSERRRDPRDRALSIGHLM